MNNLFKKLTITLLLVVAFSFLLLALGKIDLKNREKRQPWTVKNEETGKYESPTDPSYTSWMYGGKDPEKGDEITQEIVDQAKNEVVPAILETGEKAIEYASSPEVQEELNETFGQ